MHGNVRLEKEQSMLRLAGLLVWSVYFFIIRNDVSINNTLTLAGLSIVYVFASIIIKILIESDLISEVVRRYFGVIIDIFITTIIMHLLLGIGDTFFGVYFWVTVGNGF